MKKHIKVTCMIIVLCICLFSFKHSANAFSGKFELIDSFEMKETQILDLISLKNGCAFIRHYGNKYSIYDEENRKIIYRGKLKQFYVPASNSSALLLDNGKILIIGHKGLEKNELKDSQINSYGELYDIETNNTIFTVPIPFPTFGFQMVKLLDGKVLIAGGPRYSKKIYIFEPETNTFKEVAELNEGRFSHSLALLKDGNVLIIGGSAENGEILDTKSMKIIKTFKFKANKNAYGLRTKAITLNDGRVLIIYPQRNPEYPQYSDTVDYLSIYNPITNECKEVTLNNKYKVDGIDATLLKDGTVLITGGKTILKEKKPRCKVLSSAEIFNPATDRIIPLKNKMKHPRYGHKTVTLKNGTVLIIGGYDNIDFGIKDIELFTPSK